MASSDASEGFVVIEEFWTVFTDPAHIMAEIASALVWDILIVLLLWPLIRRWLTRFAHKIHEEIDEAHGVEHD
jgi:hypothetical protein